MILPAGQTEIDVSALAPIDYIKAVMVVWLDENQIEHGRHLLPLGRTPLQDGDPVYSFSRESNIITLSSAFEVDTSIKIVALKPASIL